MTEADFHPATDEFVSARDAIGTFIAEHPEPWTDGEGTEFEHLLDVFNVALKSTFLYDLNQQAMEYMKAKAIWYPVSRTVLASNSPEMVQQANETPGMCGVLIMNDTEPDDTIRLP